MLRPAWVAEKMPAPSNSVLFDSTRSAEPPTIVGVNGFSACITVRPASRVATSSPAGNTGSASRQPSRGSPRRSSSRSCARSGKAAAQAARRPSHSRCSSAPRSATTAMCSRTASETANVASGSKPIASFVARTSASPSGAPCAFEVSIACGAG